MRSVLCYTVRDLREELPKYDDIIYGQQAAKVVNRQGNTSRHQVKPGVIIAWFLLALAAVSLWLLHLLGYLSFPY